MGLPRPGSRCKKHEIKLKNMRQAKVNVTKLWMSQKEAQKYLGVSKDWLKNKRNTGVLHFSMVGTTAFYIKAEIDNLIRNCAVSGTGIFKQTK
jgi:hypothetical protein